MPKDDATKWDEGTVLEYADGSRKQLIGMQWVDVTVDSKREAAALGLIDKGVANVLNTPAAISEMAGEGLAATAGLYGAGLQGVKDSLLGNDVSLGSMKDDYLSAYRGAVDSPFVQATKRFPRAPEDVGARVRAGVRSIGPGDPYHDLIEQERIRTEQAKILFPGAFGYGGGSFAADAGTMLAARRPAALARSRQSAERIAAASERAKNFREAMRKLPDDLQEELGDVFSRKVLPSLTEVPSTSGTAGVKALEAGLEGAFLAALNDSDPVSVGAASAGAQAAGSFGLAAGLKPIQHAGRKITIPLAIAGYVAGGFVLHEMLKAFAPGDQAFFESKDFAINTAIAAFVVGMGGALTGAGRLRGGIAADYATFADAVTSIPRTLVQTRLVEFVDNRREGNVGPEYVSAAMYHRPDLFNKDQRRSLERAWNSEKKGAFTKEVQRLYKDSPSFRRDYDLMMQDLRPVPGDYEPAFTPNPAQRMYELTPTHPIERGSQ